jgi:hypothetical protein
MPRSSPRGRVLAFAAFAAPVALVAASFLLVARPGVAAEDDRAVAEALLHAAKGGETASAAADAGSPAAGNPGVDALLARARAALARADTLRAAGDSSRARLADGLARDWAETARDANAAAEAEARAEAARRNALDAGATLERERALLEENVARVGRLRAQLETLESGGAAAAAKGGDAGAPKAGKR